MFTAGRDVWTSCGFDTSSLGCDIGQGLAIARGDCFILKAPVAGLKKANDTLSL